MIGEGRRWLAGRDRGMIAGCQLRRDVTSPGRASVDVPRGSHTQESGHFP
jgi:hypothetical protein